MCRCDATAHLGSNAFISMRPQIVAAQAPAAKSEAAPIRNASMAAILRAWSAVCFACSIAVSHGVGHSFSGMPARAATRPVTYLRSSFVISPRENVLPITRVISARGSSVGRGCAGRRTLSTMPPSDPLGTRCAATAAEGPAALAAVCVATPADMKARPNPTASPVPRPEDHGHRRVFLAQRNGAQ
jgi:hypothetical protein